MLDTEEFILILPYSPRQAGKQEQSKLQDGRHEIPREWEGGGDGSAAAAASRAIPGSISISGTLPAASEVQTAIENAYSSAGLIPLPGDLVYMTEFHYMVFGENVNGSTISGNDTFRVQFTVGGLTYTAIQFGPTRLL